MKKLFPAALMLCLLFTLSSFAPVHVTSPAIKKAARTYSFPITGSTDGTPGQGMPAGIINYTITGSGTTPYSISFTTQAGASLGTYTFSLSSPGNYLATGMKTQTSISGVYFHISGACLPGYCLEFIGGV